MVTFPHLGKRMHKLQKGLIPLTFASHADISHDRQSQRIAIDLNRVSPNDPVLLHPPHSLGGR